MKKLLLITLSLFISLSIMAQTETYVPAGKYKVNKNGANAKGAKSTGWFVQFVYPTWDNTGEAGCESDGTYIYTVRWNLDLYYRYDNNGNYLATFTVPGTSQIRDLAYDGNFFYGSPSTNTIYEMRFTPGSEALISSFNAPAGVTIRSIAYIPPPTDGFFVSDWSGNENWTAITRAGVEIPALTIPYASHQVDGNYALAYDDISPNGPYLWGLCQSFDPAQINACHFVQVEIATGLQTGLWIDVANDPAINIPGGSAGGAYMQAFPNFPGTVSLCGNIQNNALFGYDLASTIPKDNDLALTALITPVTSNILGATEIVEVEITNVGLNDQFSSPVSYQINGGAVVTETWSSVTPLSANQSVNYQFTQTADLSTPGDYNFTVYTAMPGDQFLDNDTLHTLVTNTFGQYCTAGARTCTDEYIARVEIGPIDNSSGNGCPLGYTNYKNLWCSVTAGIAEQITVTVGNPFAGDGVTVWIDYNTDGDFDDPFEDKNLSSTNGVNFTGNLMPNNYNTVIDSSVMRIRVDFSPPGLPCGNSGYGEVEDYSVELIPGTPCTFSCAMGATPEFEPCGLDWNGGCNMGTPAYQDLFSTFSETVCGTAWYDGATRDTDWYRFVLTTSKIITLKCDAEFTALFGILDMNNGCAGAGWWAGNTYTLTSGFCVTPLDSVQAALPPGEYVAFCAPDFATTFLCTDTMEYNLHYIVYDPPPPCVVTCPPGATPEFEPCGNTWNDGCNMATPAYQDIVYGETACGTAFVNATDRDTDWYKFTVASNASVTVTTTAEFQADIAIIDISNGCGFETILAYDDIDSCEVGVLDMVLAPGTYVAFVAPQFSMFPFLSCTHKNAYNLTLTYNGPPVTYCETLYYFGCVNGVIDTFQLNTLVNNASGCGPGGYSDHTNMTTDLEAGLSYDLKVATNNDNEYVSMWIDFNDNFYFDANEMIFADQWCEFGYQIYTFPAHIPFTGTLGSHRLRIRINEGASSADPCAIYEFGECEDYMVNITVPAPCDVVCPPGSIAEVEVCGSMANDGCNMLPNTPAYENILDGETVCGTAWYDGLFRDTDWYKFDVTYITPITITAKAEFDYEIAFIDITNGCAGQVVLANDYNAACDVGTLTYYFYPGTYVAYLAPDLNGTTFTCTDDNEYYLNLDFVWDAPCVISCPPGATMEGEVCGDSLNNGCNLAAPVFGGIANGEVICGTAWKQPIIGGTLRDTDWFLFTNTEVSDVTIMGRSEFDCQVAIIDIPTCNGSTVMTYKDVDACTDYNLKYYGLPPGTYVAFIAPQPGDTMSCINWYNHYKIELLIEGPTWCHSSATNAFDTKVDSVAFNTIMNGSSGPNCRMYSDFTSISTDVKIGFTYPLTIQTGTCGNDYEKGVKVYIDWNADLDFYDPGEEVAAFGLDTPPTQYTANITVPLDAMSGATTRMRVVCMETNDMGLIDPCGEYPYGETEDYTIHIVPRIVTIADSVTMCAGTVVIPITTEHSNDVAAISMALNIDPSVLSYQGIQNIHPELSIPGSSPLLVFQAGATVTVSWFNTIAAANIGFGTMFELVFNAIPGQSDLIWDDITPGECEYSDPNLNILASTWIDGWANCINCSVIDGILSYADTLVPHQAMNNTLIYLEENLVPIDSTVTDAIGYYFFDVLQNGTYTLDAHSHKAWGGGNASDALAIMRHFAGLNLLQGLAVEAADVSGDNFVNTLDALYVAQRFVFMITSFPSGDWAFEVPVITVDGTGPVYQDFFALCYGDVNASYLVPFTKVAPTITLNKVGVKEIRANEVFEVPVSVLNSHDVGAISLVFDYPADKLEVIDVKVNSPHGNLLYNAVDGQLRIAWYNLEATSLSANEALLTLECKAIGSVENVEFTLDGTSELSDGFAAVIDNATLQMPKLQAVPGAPDDYALSYNHPNPFNGLTQIEYKLPEAGDVNLTVFNLLGEQVEVLVNQMQSEGTYLVNFDGSNLVSGVYLYKIEVKGATKNFVKTRMMVVTE